MVVLLRLAFRLRLVVFVQLLKVITRLMAKQDGGKAIDAAGKRVVIVEGLRSFVLLQR